MTDTRIDWNDLIKSNHPGWMDRNVTLMEMPLEELEKAQDRVNKSPDDFPDWFIKYLTECLFIKRK